MSSRDDAQQFKLWANNGDRVDMATCHEFADMAYRLVRRGSHHALGHEFRNLDCHVEQSPECRCEKALFVAADRGLPTVSLRRTRVKRTKFGRPRNGCYPLAS
ncbi:MAG: hypothetical protein OES29_13925 [Desulfuromonadales bacterium]|nr:hypothetical protein [Desulfuromonadales bacterium]